MVPPSSGRISRVPPYSSTAGHFLRPTGLSPALAGLSIPLRSFSMPRNPSGLLPFRSPLLRESRLISFPPGTEMFQFPGLASPGLCIRPGDTQNAWVAPFGTATVKDPLRLAWHFRGLARPSSPADAKASPACIPSLESCFQRSSSILFAA